MEIKYIDRNFRKKSVEKIEIANQIIEEYQEQGFDLTLRQLYYQMVARDYIPNNQKEYDRLGTLISNARLAGLIDWNSIVDRTRHVRSVSHWSDEASILRSCARSFKLDKWDNQDFRPRVWIEKDALIGVIGGICAELDVPYMSCRGFLSQSALWREAQTILYQQEQEQRPVVIHLGDHDPSGIDMTRDIEDRLDVFEAFGVKVDRIALNFNQVEEYSPPPNFAKETDSRYRDYAEKYGSESWELDALEPSVLVELIRSTVLALRDDDAWDKMVEEENFAIQNLEMMSRSVNGIIDHLRNGDEG